MVQGQPQWCERREICNSPRPCQNEGIAVLPKILAFSYTHTQAARHYHGAAVVDVQTFLGHLYVWTRAVVRRTGGSGQKLAESGIFDPTGVYTQAAPEATTAWYPND